jgi:O-acetyl-ADP-ribose deacetylase (regulator of RNase III)
MLVKASGDIFESGADILVNPVNCVGVMGKGLALQFKTRYPNYFISYKRMCDQGLLTPGAISHTYIASDGKILVSFPTKLHWRDSSQMEWIRSGLISMMDRIEESYPDATTIAVPALGAGFGRLDPKEVGTLISEVLGSWQRPNTTVMVYAPF